MSEVGIDFQWQRGDSDRWLELDPILLDGEPGLEKDTGKFKIGDEFHKWSELPYFLNEDGTEALITQMIADIGGGTFDPRVGDLNDLSTVVKTDLVSAINEVNVAPIEFTLLYENAKAG